MRQRPFFFFFFGSRVDRWMSGVVKRDALETWCRYFTPDISVCVCVLGDPGYCSISFHGCRTSTSETTISIAHGIEGKRHV